MRRTQGVTALALGALLTSGCGSAPRTDGAGDGAAAGEVSESQAAVTAPSVVAGPAVGTLPNRFAVTDDGANTHTIPIEVPAGRAGLQPTLALTYSSRSGNGLLGVGWSLSGMSQISRCRNNLRRDHQALPVRFAATDKFCLDGLPLIQVAGANAAGGAVGQAEFRTVPDSFSKIIAERLSGDAVADGPTRWTVYTKDGRVLQYGFTADAQRGATEDVLSSDTATTPVARRFAWALNRVSDRSGNYLTWTYINGVNGATTELFPRQIDYTAASGVAANRQVAFGYVPRADPRTAWLHGVGVQGTVLLSTITTRAPSETGAPMVVRTYNLTYETAALSHASRLTSVSATDSQGVTLPATRMTYGTGAPTFTRSTLTPMAWPHPTAAPFYAVADFDGDGRDDLLYHLDNGQIGVRRSAGAALGAEVAYALVDGGLGVRVGLSAYDGDGDGRVDLYGEYEQLGCTAGVDPGCTATTPRAG